MIIKVKKFDPSVDDEPYWAEGDVEYQEHMSALQALTAFRENVEPVSYDLNCTGGLCGRCAMTIDGTPALACITPIDDSEHTFEPLSGYPVIRDLVIDKSLTLDTIVTILQRVKLEPFTEANLIPQNYSKDDDDLMNTLETCQRCGLCNAVCPALADSPDRYIGPAAMVATAYRYLDPYDSGSRLVDAVAGGLYRCIQCGRCDMVCPKSIDHLSLWTRLRTDAEAANLKPSYSDEVEANRDAILAKAPAIGESSGTVDCSSCHDDGRKQGDTNPHGY